MRALYRIPLLAISTLLLLKCLKKLEEMNDYVRSPPPVKSTEQPASRPPRFVKMNSYSLASFGIKSYRIIRAIHDETKTDKQRYKRSNIENNVQRILTLELDHKNITLVLKNTNEFFTTNADIHFGSETFLPINSSILYEGYVLDQPDTSYVTGGFYSNSFDGIIKLSNETWHIEPTRKYNISLFDNGSSIIYNALDVDMTTYNDNEAFRYKRYINEESSFCGLDDKKKREQMREESEHLNEEEDSSFAFKSRYRRSTTNSEQTCCHIYIRVDPTLWDIVYKNEGLNEKEATIHALVTFLHRTVSAANALYRSVKFQSNKDYLYRFTLRIKRIRIVTPDDCQQKNISISEKNICRPYLDSNVFLTWHSAENFAEYCLAYIFSARDFGDGTLGLAWMGSIMPNSRGGICEKPAKDIYEGQRIIKTLNTGMITIINHNTRTSALMTELTFAHEIGHSLGAEVKKMGSVVIAVKNNLHGKVNCLTECSQSGYCGNRNVEDGEECDCGFVSECTDHCCYPADGPDPKLSCKLKPGARCSPSRGPSSQDCIGNVRCDGIQSICPLNDTQYFKAVDTPCNQYTALCDRGECNKSICTLIGKTECTLTIPNVVEPLRQRGIDREYLCHIGCFEPRTNSCIDTQTLEMPNNHSKTGFGYKHRPGHACAGTAGYCDVFGKCRAVDAEGPLTRLKNMLLSEANIRTLTELTQDYWWVLILGCLGLLGFISIFVKICSVHTPSSNPRFKPARSISFTHGSRDHRITRFPKSPSSLSGIELDSIPSHQIRPRSDNQNNNSHL
ncbi:hypothetical protein I4U23_003337 [Adineta vaga]|nr:hypothetical protein I4U23_003337 [Adineta vaga]